MMTSPLASQNIYSRQQDNKQNQDRDRLLVAYRDHDNNIGDHLAKLNMFDNNGLDADSPYKKETHIASFT